MRLESAAGPLVFDYVKQFINSLGDVAFDVGSHRGDGKQFAQERSVSALCRCEEVFKLLDKIGIPVLKGLAFAGQSFLLLVGENKLRSRGL